MDWLIDLNTVEITVQTWINVNAQEKCKTKSLRSIPGSDVTIIFGEMIIDYFELK